MQIYGKNDMNEKKNLNGLMKIISISLFNFHTPRFVENFVIELKMNCWQKLIFK